MENPGQVSGKEWDKSKNYLGHFPKNFLWVAYQQKLEQPTVINVLNLVDLALELLSTECKLHKHLMYKKVDKSTQVKKCLIFFLPYPPLISPFGS